MELVCCVFFIFHRAAKDECVISAACGDGSRRHGRYNVDQVIAAWNDGFDSTRSQVEPDLSVIGSALKSDPVSEETDDLVSFCSRHLKASRCCYVDLLVIL